MESVPSLQRQCRSQLAAARVHAVRSAERQFARARKTASDDEDERLYGTDEAHERERLETEVAVIEEKLQDEMDAAQGAVKEKAQAAIKRIEEQAAADKEALEAKHRAALAELRKEGGKQAELDNADREYDCVAEEHREEKDARLEALEAERGAGQRALYQSQFGQLELELGPLHDPSSSTICVRPSCRAVFALAEARRCVACAGLDTPSAAESAMNGLKKASLRRKCRELLALPQGTRPRSEDDLRQQLERHFDVGKSSFKNQKQLIASEMREMAALAAPAAASSTPDAHAPAAHPFFLASRPVNWHHGCTLSECPFCLQLLCPKHNTDPLVEFVCEAYMAWSPYQEDVRGIIDQLVCKNLYHKDCFKDHMRDGHETFTLSSVVDFVRGFLTHKCKQDLDRAQLLWQWLCFREGFIQAWRGAFEKDVKFEGLFLGEDPRMAAKLHECQASSQTFSHALRCREMHGRRCGLQNNDCDLRDLAHIDFRHCGKVLPRSSLAYGATNKWCQCCDSRLAGNCCGTVTHEREHYEVVEGWACKECYKHFYTLH